MVFRGKPSKACERCRARRLRVSPNLRRSVFPDLRLRCSVTFMLVHVASVLGQTLLVLDTGIPSNSEYKMKASLLRREP
jgi:hypothetical protein